MNQLLKAIKIALLKRQLVELYGNIKRYSNKIKEWEKISNTMICSKSGFYADRQFNEMQGNIAYFSKKIITWKRDFESKKSELESLGVKVELTL